MPAASQDVDGSLPDVQRNRPQLLNGIHHQPNSALPAQFAQLIQVNPVAVVPLHRADRYDAGAGCDSLGKIVDEYFAITVQDNIDLNTFRLPLHPRHRDF